MNNQTDTQDTYPPLPYPAMEDVPYELWGQNAIHAALFTAAQMRFYVDADRTLRAGTSPSLSDEDIAKSIGLSFGGRENDFKRFAEAVRRTLRAGQSEPVAWRVKVTSDRNDSWTAIHGSRRPGFNEYHTIEPLYLGGAGQSPTVPTTGGKGS